MYELTDPELPYAADSASYRLKQMDEGGKGVPEQVDCCEGGGADGTLSAASNDLLGKAVCYCSKLQLEVWTDEVRPELDCTTDQLKLH
ncbi:MAG: hypothetical protein BRD55_08340 [Bacteroidetes bacterium SW_9_63_38]|nr:MAG: hypothetical protein BRD55_08340 [Bacteroidetes bacterium SW_9_63_38]